MKNPMGILEIEHRKQTPHLDGSLQELLTLILVHIRSGEVHWNDHLGTPVSLHLRGRLLQVN